MEQDKQYTRNKRFFKSFFDVRAWVDYDRLVESGNMISRRFKRLFTVQKPKEEMTFSEAMQKYEVTEEELKIRESALKRIAILMLIVTFMVGGLAAYQFTQSRFYIGFICLAFTGLPLTLAFRYHFLYFQFKQRRLGCSLREWMNFIFRGTK